MPSGPKPLRIVCPNFSNDEVDALRSLVGLLRPYLKHVWLVEESDRGDVCFVNLDAAATHLPIAHDMRVVGCSLRPRLHAQGTIHRPLRVPEILAVLSDVATARAGEGTSASATQDITYRYRLRAWPIGFERWQKPWWFVLAAIAHAEHTVEEIAERTGVPMRDVHECLSALVRLDAVDRLAQRLAGTSAMPPRGSWRSLVLRVGQALGFA
jgi:hypothetical protein